MVSRFLGLGEKKKIRKETEKNWDSSWELLWMIDRIFVILEIVVLIDRFNVLFIYCNNDLFESEFIGMLIQK